MAVEGMERRERGTLRNGPGPVVEIIDVTSPAAATLANAPSQGEIVACLAAMIKYGQQVTEKSKEWAPLKAELERNEKVEQEGKEEIKELKRKRAEIERQMAEKERDVETAASRSAISRKKMGRTREDLGRGTNRADP